MTFDNLDVMPINGIGGYGENTLRKGEPVAWKMDCLKESGCLRLWCNNSLEVEGGAQNRRMRKAFAERRRVNGLG